MKPSVFLAGGCENAAAARTTPPAAEANALSSCVYGNRAVAWRNAIKRDNPNRNHFMRCLYASEVAA
jgi:hypothetical protein